MKHLTHSSRETQKLASNIARKIISSPLPGQRGAFVVALKGDLGGGKTTFAQGFAEGLGVKEKITSPTFNIYRRYKNFYHFDCYRVEKPEEILRLGFLGIISDPKNIVLIEWAENIREILPAGAKWINFEFVDETTRRIDISPLE